MGMFIEKVIDRCIGIPICFFLGLFKKSFNKSKDADVKKILFIKIFGFGNIILSLPAVNAIKKKYPKAKICYLTDLVNKDILEGHPLIDRVVYYKSKLKGIIYNTIKLLLYLRKQKFDIIFDFEQFCRISSIISYLSGTKLKIGFNTKGQGRGHLYDIKVRCNNNQHVVKTFCDISKAVGIKSIDTNLVKLHFSNEDKKFINQFLQKNKLKNNTKLVGIHAGSGINVLGKRWDKKNFAQLADYLIKRYKVKIYFTGSKAEDNLIKNIIKLMKEKGSINAINLFTIKQLAYLVSKSDLFISNCTGPLHLASMMNTPIIGFYGPSTPLWYGPLSKKKIVLYKNMKCSPCMTNYNEKSTKCKHFKCMKMIKLQEVIDKISKSKILK